MPMVIGNGVDVLPALAGVSPQLQAGWDRPKCAPRACGDEPGRIAADSGNRVPPALAGNAGCEVSNCEKRGCLNVSLRHPFLGPTVTFKRDHT